VAAATPEIAIVQRLKAGATAAGARVYPEVNTPEPVYPFITVTRLGAEGKPKLSGQSGKLKPFTIQVDHYAAGKAEMTSLAAEVRALLAPEDGDPWRDPGNGVQGCFYQDSSDESLPTESADTLRSVREIYLVWHFPT
jgi:hypothetical protein